MEIVIDCNQIISKEQFYNFLLPVLEAPCWHGRNLDALADSLVTGSINGVEPPFTLVSIGTGLNLKPDMKAFQLKVLTIFLEASVQPERQITVVLK
ncbi:barstar family protein [Salinimonas sp. HHU 13199]|uniref:Barstar family protein n=1 Tax=Salinimonas profundi TaxID=2729140 RepID=A0ABR8LNQ2_9ALTE|nr:barstar family protein [Salinimonas profundi]MBD3587362.1 barstar family protein [Salinimonas profundi]